MKRVLKALGWLLLALIMLLAIFVAANWTLARNLSTAIGKKYAETAHLQPIQPVKGCGERGLTLSSDTPVASEALTEMQAFSDRHSGLGLIVLVDGKVVHEHYAKGITPTSVTQSLSLNKSVTSLMTGVALGDGTLKSIDDPVAPLLPEWSDAARGKITLRHLLSMSSGLHNYSMSKADWPAMKLMLSDEIEATALTAAAENPPGSLFKYKNGDAQIAGAVLRRAIAKAHKGESYASYLSRTLWCGVGNHPATLWAESEEGAPRFYAGLQASLRDWARIGQLVLDKGRVGEKQIVPEAYIDQMTAPSSANARYGLFIWRGTPWAKDRVYSPEAGINAHHSAPYAANDVAFMDGYGGQRVYIVPSAKLVIARLSEPDQKFDDAPLVNLALAGMERNASPPTPQKSRPPSP